MSALKKNISWRYFLICSILVAAGIAIVGKALYIMTVQKEFWERIDSRFQKTNVPIRATRGDILADNGELLAASIPEFKLFLDFVVNENDSLRRVKETRRRDSLFTAKLDSICYGLQRILPDVNPKATKAHLLEGMKKRSRYWALYPKRVSYLQYQAILKLPYLNQSRYKSGLTVEKYESRKQPYGRLAARTVGDLFAGKDEARSGLELGLDSILRGKPGMSHRQKVMNKYLTIVDVPAQDGCDVQTTLNIQMQDICEQALGEQLKKLNEDGSGQVEFGVCILMEVATGDVKAITSLSRMADGSFREVQNKAISNLMEPGSVFKPMSFLVAMNDGFLKMDDQIYVGNGIYEMHGRKMRDHNWRTGGYGMLTARQAIQKSSNVGVSVLIDRFYGQNPQKFVDNIYATGVADDLHIPIPGYAKPRIKSPKSKYWAKTDLPWMSIGYVTQIPPISTLTFYNGIANNGKMMRPRFVKAILKDGEIVKNYDPVVVRDKMAKDEAVANVQTMLREVVTLGVGKQAGSKLVHVAGKTGTAQVWSAAGRTAGYLVSFAGFFPFENPKYSCIVCINKTGAASGGGQCGPVFRRVAETVMAQELHQDYKTARDTVHDNVPFVSNGNLRAASGVLSMLGIAHDDYLQANEAYWGQAMLKNKRVVLNSQATEAQTVPDLSGYGLRDALFSLENLGLKVRTLGVGRVKQQSLQPGHKCNKGESITIVLGCDMEMSDLSDSLIDVQADSLLAPSKPVATSTAANTVMTKQFETNSSVHTSKPPQAPIPKTEKTKTKAEATKPGSKKKNDEKPKEKPKALNNENNLKKKKSNPTR